MPTVAAATAVLTVGEALVLVFIMLVIRKAQSPWVTPVNVGLIATDVILGLILLSRLGVVDPERWGWIVIVAVVLLLVTHLYRDVELAVGRPNPFAFSIGLIIVNNIKLAGFAATLVWVLRTAT